MKIINLQVENLRNLANVSLKPHPDFNFVLGENGAGKTSILESLFVLSRGRSFRTTTTQEMLGPASTYFRIFAETEQDNGIISRLGLERSGKNWKARKNSLDLARISDLTRSLPLVLMEPNSHQLISGPPEFRRKYLDSGVFHVEHGFVDTWKRYFKALKQRNSALKQGRQDVIDSIDEIMAPLGERLDKSRKSYAGRISLAVSTLLGKLNRDLGEIKLEYRGGWGEGSLIQALQGSTARDLESGASHVGPHRMDLVIMKGRSLARSLLSRGEQKLLSASLLLAQAKLLADLGEKPIILLDDLYSEFDQYHYQSVLSAARDNGGQLWVTGTKTSEIPENSRLFHVKHGAVLEVV